MWTSDFLYYVRTMNCTTNRVTFKSYLQSLKDLLEIIRKNILKPLLTMKMFSQYVNKYFLLLISFCYFTHNLGTVRKSLTVRGKFPKECNLNKLEVFDTSCL